MSPNPPKTLRFEEGGLKASDVTAEDVRVALDLPQVIEDQVVFGQPGNWRKTNKHKALVNPDTGKLYSIRSKDYRLVKHEEAILDIMSIVDQNPEYGAIEWSAAGTADDYKRVQLKGRFPEHSLEVRKGDLVNPTIEYFNSYDGSWGERLWFGAFRVVCSNGAMVGERVLALSAAHIGEERPQEMLPLFGEAMHSFSDQVGLYRGWVDRVLQIGHVESTLEILDLTKKERGMVLDEVDREPDMDLWTFYNTVTALVTHNIRSLDRQVRSWGRLRKAQSRWDAR